MKWALSAIAAILVAAATDMPRVAGVVIAPGERVALFDTGGAVLTRAEVGDEVDGFRVRAIERGGVQLERDGQITLLQTSGAHTPMAPVDVGGVTFGLVLRQQPPPDD